MNCGNPKSLCFTYRILEEEKEKVFSKSFLFFASLAFSFCHDVSDSRSFSWREERKKLSCAFFIIIFPSLQRPKFLHAELSLAS